MVVLLSGKLFPLQSVVLALNCNAYDLIFVPPVLFILNQFRARVVPCITAYYDWKIRMHCIAGKAAHCRISNSCNSIGIQICIFFYRVIGFENVLLKTASN